MWLKAPLIVVLALPGAPLQCWTSSAVPLRGLSAPAMLRTVSPNHPDSPPVGDNCCSSLDPLSVSLRRLGHASSEALAPPRSRVPQPHAAGHLHGPASNSLLHLLSSHSTQFCLCNSPPPYPSCPGGVHISQSPVLILLFFSLSCIPRVDSSSCLGPPRPTTPKDTTLPCRSRPQEEMQMEHFLLAVSLWPGFHTLLNPSHLPP